MDQMNRAPSPFGQSPQTVAMGKYNIARSNLLFAVIVTLVNIVLIACNSGIYFLFSVYIPYFTALIGAMFHYYPDEVADLIGTEITPDAATVFFVVCLVVAVLLLVPYLLCWIFSKRHHGWMIAALVLFSLDSLWLIVNFDISLIMDILFHAYVLYFLISGVRNGIQVKKASAGMDGYASSVPPIQFTPDGTPVALDEAPAEGETARTAVEDSPVLRTASEAAGQKVKVYAETTRDGHKITYRRVGKDTEELVVDGQVYAEMSRPRTKIASMSATVAGMYVEAGVCQGNNMIVVDGIVVASTVRWM